MKGDMTVCVALFAIYPECQSIDRAHFAHPDHRLLVIEGGRDGARTPGMPIFVFYVKDGFL